jgi:hypothetical protein
MSWKMIHVRLLFILVLFTHVQAVHAHGVVVWAEVVQDKVRVEAYLSDGQPIRQAKVKVLDPGGQQLLQGKLDKQGLYVFPRPPQDELLIRVTQGHGHTGETKLRLK